MIFFANASNCQNFCVAMLLHCKGFCDFGEIVSGGSATNGLPRQVQSSNTCSLQGPSHLFSTHYGVNREPAIFYSEHSNRPLKIDSIVFIKHMLTIFFAGVIDIDVAVLCLSLKFLLQNILFFSAIRTVLHSYSSTSLTKRVKVYLQQKHNKETKPIKDRVHLFHFE